MDNYVREVHMTRKTHDRTRMWQEVRQRNTTWSAEEGNTNANKPKKVLEAKENNQSQKTLTRRDQSNTRNKRGVNKTQKKYSAINTVEHETFNQILYLVIGCVTALVTSFSLVVGCVTVPVISLYPETVVWQYRELWTIGCSSYLLTNKKRM